MPPPLEIENTRLAVESGAGARVYEVLPGVPALVLEFLPGRTLDPAFLIPTAPRLRMGDRFVPGPWTLGRKYKVLDWIAVIEIAVISLYFVMPIVPAGVPGNDGFSWSSVNYAPIAVGGVLLLVAVWWYASARKWFTGPRRTIDEADLADVGRPAT